MRLFVAADLPAGLRARLVELQGRLGGVPLPVRWVRPEGIHLTFKFLGEVGADRLPPLREALGAARDGHTAFRLVARGAGAFPARGNPRVLWVGVDGDLDAATRLRDAVETALARAGFARDDKPFHPHLTLGRVKGPPTGEWRSLLERAGADTPPSDFEVADLVLFESRHGPGGATYLPLERFALARGAA